MIYFIFYIKQSLVLIIHLLFLLYLFFLQKSTDVLIPATCIHLDNYKYVSMKILSLIKIYFQSTYLLGGKVEGLECKFLIEI